MKKGIQLLRRVFADAINKHQKINVCLIFPSMRYGSLSMVERSVALSVSQIERYLRKGYGLNLFAEQESTSSRRCDLRPIIDEEVPITLVHPYFAPLFTSAPNCFKI